MPLCSSGTTQAKPNAQRYLVYASGAAEILAFAPGFEWLAAIAPVLGILAYDTNIICSVDPGGFVSLSGAEIFTILIGAGAPGYAAAVAKLKQNVDTVIWYQLCECAAVATPARPSAPAQPSDAPTITPTINGGGAKCYGPFSEGYFDLSSGAVKTSITYTYPTGLSSIHFQVQGSQNFGTPGGAITGSVLWKTATGVTVRTDTLLTGPASTPGTTFSASDAWGLAPPPTATNLVVTLQVAAGVKDRGGYSFTGFCGTAGPTDIGGCCQSSDPALLAAITAILAQANILQRHLVPFAYILGAVHSGLSGQGTFAVSGLAGVKVHLSTLPGSYGEAIGEPTVLFEVGWVSLLTADGFIEERRIRSVDSIWTPRLMSEATLVGYSLSPGVVATITEVELEP